MGAAVYRSAETEGRKLMSEIFATLESRPSEPAKHDVGHPIAPDFVFVREAYDRWAPTYDQSPNPLLSLEERELESLMPALRNKRVLDLACGTGRWIEKLSSEGMDVAVGIDFSEAMLRSANEKDAVRGKIVRADCYSLPFQASTFDFVVCSFAIGHIRDLEMLARELKRVARAGANIVTSDLHPEAYAKGWRTGFRDAGGSVEIDTRARNAEEIAECFYRADFECLKHLSLRLAEPERPIFTRAGKSNYFAAACKVPAILVSFFRLASSDGRSDSKQ
jgi:ubiquinone/menaquinone biosynthesis C-methylase UbiE